MYKIVIMILIINICAFASPIRVTMSADENYPPYSYVENNQLKGIYVDIIKELDKRINEFEIVLKPVPWVRGLKEIESGEAFALIAPWYRPVERPYMIYSEPLLKEELVIVTFNEKNAQIWPKDFEGKKIGKNRGFSILDEKKIKNIVIEEANGTTENLQKLVNNRLDFYINDRFSIMWELNRLVEKKLISKKYLESIKISYVLSSENSYIGYSKKYQWKDKESFQKAMDTELNKMKIEGELEKIADKYIKQLSE